MIFVKRSGKETEVSTYNTTQCALAESLLFVDLLKGKMLPRIEFCKQIFYLDLNMGERNIFVFLLLLLIVIIILSSLQNVEYKADVM